MGPLRSESTEDVGLRPTLAVLVVVVGVASIQFLVFPSTSDASWGRFVFELLLVPVLLVGSIALASIREYQRVWRPLYAGSVLVCVYATTDALDEVVAQPELFSLVFEDGVLLAGALALTVGAVRWNAQRDAHEAKLERQNERLDQFASVVSHDLRNPLNVAQMRLELAREGHGYEHLSTVADAHDRMEALIQDVLELARTGEAVGETEPVGLASVAADAVANTDLDAAGLTVESDTTLVADPERLTAVFENLFRNSVEHASASTSGRSAADSGVGSASNGPATPTADGGGPVDDDSPSDIAVEHSTSGVHVRVGPLDDGFFVEDDGPGIPPEEQERVFESGYTTDPDGTGLGLAIVSGVADAHGWSVTATSGESGGVRFEFRDVARPDEVSTSDPRP
ncbi:MULTISPECIES: HAMP domain-containing sensor histidine kinase [Haloferax]|uniref:histidine kinase n=1 Tax=Haloferax marinum TaxID=2666143 RepID=A0A6A8G3N7_9EURY|nr:MULTISPECIES: HAMP domain-containing sensor histidine kinase [Haloferax]KAB1196382.1 HAMP domain-containing histidine kinase [Haloferax sp. CBA1150]MRW95375.1 sensor histidine kinase [Haloferax marinum]